MLKYQASLWTLLLLGGLTACGEKASGEDSHAAEDSSSAQEDWAPEPGWWVVVSSTVTEDGCALSWLEDLEDTATAEEEGFTLTPTGADQEFTLTLQDEGEDFVCQWDSSQDYQCSERQAFTMDLNESGLDAVYEVRATSSGRFPSSSLMEGEQAMTLTCSGSSCELLESTLGVSYPCSMTQWVEAAWAEEPS